jgi:N-acetyl-beta-hexosaminidase
MPGHTNAALAAYPEFNCNEKDKNPKLYTGTEVGFSTFCTKNEKVYAFIEDVFTELAAITPDPIYILEATKAMLLQRKTIFHLSTAYRNRKKNR